MKLYDFLYHPRKPDGIENRRAHIVGGGIAGLAAARSSLMTQECPARTSPSTKSGRM